MHDRITQINQLIRDIVGRLLVSEVSFKAGVLVTIERVDTTRDLRYTRVSVSVFPEADQRYAMRTLSKERKSLERSLHRELATRPLPTLAFVLDETEGRADEIEQLLREVREEK
jgi:ribosome-binding factor A